MSTSSEYQFAEVEDTEAASAAARTAAEYAEAGAGTAAGTAVEVVVVPAAVAGRRLRQAAASYATAAPACLAASSSPAAYSSIKEEVAWLKDVEKVDERSVCGRRLACCPPVSGISTQVLKNKLPGQSIKLLPGFESTFFFLPAKWLTRRYTNIYRQPAQGTADIQDGASTETS